MVQGFDLTLALKMIGDRDARQSSAGSVPAALSPSPTRTLFVRSNTPSPEETMSTRRRDANLEWTLNGDEDGSAHEAPSTPFRSTEPASTGGTPQSATTSSTYGTASATTASTAAAGVPNPVVAPFNARQTDMILYLALRGCSKAATAYALRPEVSRPADVSVADWERALEGRIKAELEAMAVGPELEPQQEAEIIISRVLSNAQSGDWRNSVLAQAAKYMAAALEVGEDKRRAAVIKKMKDQAKARIRKHKERSRDAAETINTMAPGIDTRLAQQYQERIEAQYPRDSLEWTQRSEESTCKVVDFKGIAHEVQTIRWLTTTTCAGEQRLVFFRLGYGAGYGHNG